MSGEMTVSWAMLAYEGVRYAESRRTVRRAAFEHD